MKGQPIATARWRRLSGEGDDTCRLVAEPGGFMLIGHARFRLNGDEARFDYVVRCDAAWVSRSADVSGTFNDEKVGWKIERDGGHWTMNGIAVPGTIGCDDIDLGFTPATNLLPVRRLAMERGVVEPVAAVWFRYPEGRAERLDQSYERLSDDRVRYRARGFQTDLSLHPSGFVIRYPEGWDGEVDDG